MKLRNLWVMRHGLAVDQFDSDFTRQLSDFGKQQAKDVALQILDTNESQPQDMLVSPFCRTQMTANIVHATLGLKKPFITEELLVHFADHRLLGDFLMASEYENLIIVSHTPIVAHLCRYLLDDADSFYGFETAQVMKINFKKVDNESSPSEKKLARMVKCYLPQC
ncbi:MAG: phosphoglycerate mutase family protein [Enterobacterales bacterium]|nr:phosphoglycerate mutase family protein [Enterobacterales bacterium]